MNSKIKSLMLVIVLVSIAACSKQPTDNTQQPYEGDGKTNLKKAALLNIELGEGYLAQGQVSRAKKKLIHALELAPNLPEAHTAMGYFFETVGDDPMAEKHYRKAIFLGKGQATFHDNYANYLCGRGKYIEADKEFTVAMKDYNYAKTAQIYENAGLCALQAVDLLKAENYFKTAVRYDPSQVTSMLELSALFFKRGDTGQAQYFLDRLRQIVEPTPRILWLAIQVARKNNDKDAVASNALLLKNLFANSPEYKLYLQTQEDGV